MLQQCKGSVNSHFLFAMAAEAALVEAGDAQMQVRELSIQIKNKIFKQQKEFSLRKKYRSRVQRNLTCMGRWARCTGARYGSGTLRSETVPPQASRRPDGYSIVQVKNSECLFGGRVTQCFNLLSWGCEGGAECLTCTRWRSEGLAGLATPLVAFATGRCRAGVILQPTWVFLLLLIGVVREISEVGL